MDLDLVRPVKVMDVELSAPIKDIEGMHRYGSLQALIRLYGRPIGYVVVPVAQGRCLGTNIIEAVVKTLRPRLDREGFPRRFSYRATPEGWRTDGIPNDPFKKSNGPFPLVSVAVCTRDRDSHLKACLDSLQNLSYPRLDIMVVDNAPRTNAAKRLVNGKFSNMRYLVEPRPGLDWARNRAIMESQGEILAFTDDDVVVDPGWIDALVKVFMEDPEVMAVTGLVVPYELETRAQILFEAYGGFGKGFESRRFRRFNPNGGRNWSHLKAGDLGTGANMAFRRSIFGRIGGFDPALDVGTVSCGGGDLEILFRVVQEGHTLVYEPNAVVRHVHRRGYKVLKNQIRNWGTAFVAYLMRSAIAYPEARYKIGRFTVRWFVGRHLIRVLKNPRGPKHVPLNLMWAELSGSLSGLFAYQKARQIARQIEADFGPMGGDISISTCH
ncbi:MAG: glycosyltransferase [Desulfatiglandaceae bacterium]